MDETPAERKKQRDDEEAIRQEKARPRKVPSSETSREFEFAKDCLGQLLYVRDRNTVAKILVEEFYQEPGSSDYRRSLELWEIYHF